MDELLQKLLEAEVLTEETKTSIEEAFKSQMVEAIAEAKEEATTLTTAEVRAELAEQWVSEKEALVEALDTQIGTYLGNEMNELRSDIESFRDLEAEYAEKIVEAKQEMAIELRENLNELVEKTSTFLEIRMNSELEELREDFKQAKQDNAGRKMFEAFSEQYSQYIDVDGANATLASVEAQLEETVAQLNAIEEERDVMVREGKLSTLLAPLSGHQKAVMEAILKNVATSDLEEGYSKFIGRILKESAEDISENEEIEVIAEDVKTADTAEVEVIVETGDLETPVVTESAPEETNADLEELKRLAGI